MVKAQKKGEAGPSVNYVTRNKAIRTLQITLKDFRRLCILKGIYPRDPPKKKHGKDKTYYHIKDIKFLRHEPLLQALRDDKARLKKLKKAIGRQDKTRVEALKAGKPAFKVDHIVKERYPTFLDALRDLDDALCMVFLFASLPTKTVPYHDAVVAATCVRLVREWQSYVFYTNALRKTFVSIKGVYYQAEVQAQTITWLVPHKFSPNIPSDVDYRVMLTFLEFYTTMMKFVLFKLYFDVGLKYPPLLDASKDANAEGLNLLTFESLTGKVDGTKAAAAAAGAGADAKDLRDGTKQISGAVLNKLAAAAKSSGAAAAAADAAAAAADAEEAKAEAVDTQLFDKLNRDAPVLTAAQTEELKVKRLFAGLTFFIAREVPGDPLEFILLNGSARVLREDGGASAQDDSSITHMIVDRPVQTHRLLAREYVQPQWVFDSFNTRALLPTTPYAPGAVPPPHLSPFVDDEKEGYVPKQRKVLQEWGAAANAAATGTTTPAAAAAAADDADGEGDGGADGFDSDSDNDHDLEQYELDAQEERADAQPQVAGSSAAAYAQGLSSALAGKPAAAAAAAADAEDADADADGEGESEGEGEAGDGDAEASAPAPAAAAKAKAKAGASSAAAAAARPGGKRKAAEAAAADAAARIMMPKKDKRLLHRMEHGIKKKADANAALEARRQQLEAAEAKPTSKRQKKH